jgi:hypothetical protein
VSRPIRLLLLLAVLLVALPVFAEPPTAPSAKAGAPPAASGAPVAPGAPPADSWAGQIDTLSRWLEQQRRAKGCTERCFALDRLKLSGRVGDGPLHFELTGSVLAAGPTAVPLFGPPAELRVEGATEDGKDAIIGFEGDHYYLFTASRRFVLKGTLWLGGDLALTIPGPLNALEADVTAGAVVEGPRLTGLTGATVHLTREGAAQASGPTVFQLSRAVRVGREIGFEYRLVMRSGSDLGVVRLPLPFGEKVLDVAGASGWRVEQGELPYTNAFSTPTKNSSPAARAPPAPTPTATTRTAATSASPRIAGRARGRPGGATCGTTTSLPSTTPAHLDPPTGWCVANPLVLPDHGPCARLSSIHASTSVRVRPVRLLHAPREHRLRRPRRRRRDARQPLGRQPHAA